MAPLSVFLLLTLHALAEWYALTASYTTKYWLLSILLWAQIFLLCHRRIYAPILEKFPFGYLPGTWNSVLKSKAYFYSWTCPFFDVTYVALETFSALACLTLHISGFLSLSLSLARIFTCAGSNFSVQLLSIRAPEARSQPPVIPYALSRLGHLYIKMTHKSVSPFQTSPLGCRPMYPYTASF